MPSENLAQKSGGGGGGQDTALSSDSSETDEALDSSDSWDDYPPISRGKAGPGDDGDWDDHDRLIYYLIETTGWPYWCDYFMAYQKYKKLPKGKVKIKIKPDDAWVYVNGEFVGIVDDFNGPFQYLKLKQGSYTLMIHKPGYQPHVIQIQVEASKTLHVEHQFVK